MNLKILADAELIVSMRNLVRREDEIVVSVIEHISEIQSRRLFLKYGFKNSFEFLTKHFHYSNALAQRRIDIAWLSEEFPEVKSGLLNKEYSATQLAAFTQAVRKKEKSSPISTELKAQILNSIKYKTIEETDQLIAQALDLPPLQHEKHRRQADGSLKIECRLTPEQERLFIMVKERMSHVNPNPNFVEAFEYLALKFTKEPATRKAKPSANPRHVSKEAERDLHRKQDGCQWIDPMTGRRCGSRFQMQVDHIQPLWAGGTSEPENLQILCSHHNKRKYELEMELYHGLHPLP